MFSTFSSSRDTNHPIREESMLLYVTPLMIIIIIVSQSSFPRPNTNQLTCHHVQVFASNLVPLVNCPNNHNRRLLLVVTATAGLALISTEPSKYIIISAISSPPGFETNKPRRYSCWSRRCWMLIIIITDNGGAAAATKSGWNIILTWFSMHRLPLSLCCRFAVRSTRCIPFWVRPPPVSDWLLLTKCSPVSTHLLCSRSSRTSPFCWTPPVRASSSSPP